MENQGEGRVWARERNRLPFAAKRLPANSSIVRRPVGRSIGRAQSVESGAGGRRAWGDPTSPDDLAALRSRTSRPVPFRLSKLQMRHLENGGISFRTDEGVAPAGAPAEGVHMRALHAKGWVASVLSSIAPVIAGVCVVSHRRARVRPAHTFSPMAPT